ncbi:MAG: ATP-binding cassette domain-containing protein, partial [Synergistaceae bacterium]|nr:ATP-binding cassette domain-containing protein [Synergistaceae bacterium]
VAADAAYQGGSGGEPRHTDIPFLLRVIKHLTRADIRALSSLERERATARRWPSFSLLIRTRKRRRKLSNTPFIELRSVSFAYEAESKNALNNISLKIYEGERVVILGHNGSGKSTLAKIMGALQNSLQGVCLIQNHDVREIKFEELRALIGMVFQNPDNQIIASVLEDDIAFAPENQGLNSEIINKLVNHAIKVTGLENKAGALTSEMSGGEKQRMALAGAVAAQVKCLILDEPTAMLDPEGRVQVEKVIKELHKSGVTIIQITHQLEFFDDKNNLDVDRVLVLSHGELVWEGTPEKFLPLAESMGFEKFEKPVSLEELKNILAENFKFGEGKAERESRSENFNRGEGKTESLSANDELTSKASEKLERKAENKNFIEIKNLYFKFASSERNILENINLNIKRGEWLSITGRTGSGKSTLVQHLNALYKIQAGKILIDDKDLPQAGPDVKDLRQRVGLVFQNPEDQLFCATVREELEFAPRNADFNLENLNKAVLNAINLVGLDESFLARNPLALSGGERRLVAIASVLAVEPECIILDEPLAGLDAYYKNKILNMLNDLKAQGKSIIVITHDINSALKFSNKIIILERGKSYNNLNLNLNKNSELASLSGFAGFSILGQYVPSNSIIHKLDPRAKLFAVLLLVSSVVTSSSFVQLAAFLAGLLGLIKIAKLKIKNIISSSRPIFFLAAFTFIFNLIALALDNNILLSDAFAQGAFLSSRLLMLMFYAVLLPLTTTPLELSDGIGELLKPLAKFKFPAQECAVMIGMALRFIPILMEETDKITRAQLSRGAKLDQGGIFKRLRAFFPVLIPLFIIIFRRADDMALAMEARGYNIGRKRTRRKPLKWKFNDTLAVALSFILALIFFML